jgi:lipopolysaccharide biosynthesis glycosyltransferase
MQNRFLVCTCVDDNYFWPWLVMVYSASINVKHTGHRFILANINGMLSEANVERAEKFMDSIALDFEVVNIETPLEFEYSHQFNLTGYARLFLMDLLDEDFLWLDADLLLLPGWDEIFDELGDKKRADIVIYGVKDSVSTQRRLASECNQAFERSQGRYINSGVIKISIDAWKKLPQPISWQQLAQNLSSYRLSLVDQDVLNYLCAEKISVLPEGFNYIVGDEISPDSRIFIQHYAGSPKPWQLDRNGKEFLLGIQGTKYFSPKDWITQSRDAFAYFPMYWKVEGRLMTLLESQNEIFASEVLELRERLIKPLNKASLAKLWVMRFVSKKFLF